MKVDPNDQPRACARPWWGLTDRGQALVCSASRVFRSRQPPEETPMISLPQLWLPILLSAVLVFVASSLIHMVVKWHNSDYLTLPNEDEVRAAIRKTNPAPGQYLLPRISDMSQLKTPEVQRKFTEGPVGFLALKPGAGAVVRLRPRGVDLRRLSRLADPVPGHAISQGAPGRRNHRLPRLRCGRSACSHLDGKALALGGKGARRWIHLRAADRGRVRLALAPVSARPGRELFVARFRTSSESRTLLCE